MTKLYDDSVDLLDVVMDLSEGRRRKKAGKAKAEARAPEWWKEGIRRIVVALPDDWIGQPEDWRKIALKELGAYKGYTPFVWGSMTTMLVKANLVERTGAMVPMESTKSNSRATFQYRKRK